MKRSSKQMWTHILNICESWEKSSIVISLLYMQCDTGHFFKVSKLPNWPFEELGQLTEPLWALDPHL